jgi:hypothetical protein
MDNPSFGQANVMGPEEGDIQAVDLAAATSTAYDLDTLLPGAKDRMSMVTLICDQPFWIKFAPTNATALDDTVVSGNGRAFGPYAANQCHRMRIPGLCRYLFAKSTLASKFRFYESDGEY